MKILYTEEMEWDGDTFKIDYIDDMNFSKISPIKQVQALCITNENEYVIFKDIKGNYGLPGGTVEDGEKLEDTLFRELKEEASVVPKKFGPLMYLKVTNLSKKLDPEYQVRYWAHVDLLDEPVNDPDGKSIERLVVCEDELDKHLKWGKKIELYLNSLKKQSL